MDNYFVATHACYGWEPEEEISFTVIGVFSNKEEALKISREHTERCARKSCVESVLSVPLNQYRSKGHVEVYPVKRKRGGVYNSRLVVKYNL